MAKQSKVVASVTKSTKTSAGTEPVVVETANGKVNAMARWTPRGMLCVDNFQPPKGGAVVRYLYLLPCGKDGEVMGRPASPEDREHKAVSYKAGWLKAGHPLIGATAQRTNAPAKKARKAKEPVAQAEPVAEQAVPEAEAIA